MFVMRRDGSKIINLNHVSNIYIGSDGTKISVDFCGGEGTKLESYSTPEFAESALKRLFREIGKAETFLMPTEKQLQAYMISSNGVDASHANSHNGKKIERRGQS